MNEQPKQGQADSSPVTSPGRLWLDGGYDRGEVEACIYHPDHRWHVVRVNDVHPGCSTDPEELMAICQNCFVPRCGYTTDPNPCMLPRHHREPHEFADGRTLKVGG